MPAPPLQMLLACVAAASLLAAPLALAQGAAQEAAQEPAIQFSAEGDGYRIRASIDIPAPPMAVWRVISDCDRAPTFVPNLETCRVVQRDPSGRWDIRESVVNVMFLPRVRTVARNDLTPGRRLAFQQIEGDMKASKGEWRLERTADGTQLHYDGSFTPGYSVPQFLIEGAVHRDFPAMLRAIARKSVVGASAASAR